MVLSDRDRAVLTFEQTWWTTPGSKEAAIKARLGLSATRYRQVLAALVDSDEAEAFDPLVIRRLRRRRDQQRRVRYVGRPAGGGRAR
jgi:Protein of unknown function (DUF3263)